MNLIFWLTRILPVVIVASFFIKTNAGPNLMGGAVLNFGGLLGNQADEVAVAAVPVVAGVVAGDRRASRSVTLTLLVNFAPGVASTRLQITF